MKISYNWLKDYIETEKSPEEIASLLTQSGLEVESVSKYEEVKDSLQGLVIGEVKTCIPHPNADRLRATTVDVGNETILPIVCGAPNVAVGQKVVVAVPGATLYPLNGNPFKIQKTKIRGEVSEGMICAEDEIGLGASHEGIMVLNTELSNGTPANEHFKLSSDHILEIGLTPNRADAASHLGVARDLKAILKKDLLAKDTLFQLGEKQSPITVEVENSEACPRYSGLYFSNVTVKTSPAWLKQRLKSIGLTPINNIVDITNFILHDIGQPMHAFDADKIQGKKVKVKTLPEGTLFTTLDGVVRKLKGQDLMICDGENAPMCIGGVFGGIHSGVIEQTKNVFLESAYFSPDYIRRSSLAHGLKTDAAFRYERGTDPNNTVQALKLAISLIKEIAGGEVSANLIDIYPEPIKNFEFEVAYKNIDRLIGKRLERNTVHQILESLEIEVSSLVEDKMKVSVPPYRVDVKGEADITEEILRIYGFNNIELGDTLGTSYLAEFPAKDPNKLQYKISQALAALGFQEIITNSLTKPAYSSALSAANKNKEVEILNKLSEDLGVMRQSLLFTSMEVASYNINRRQKNLKLFEFGKNYFRENGKYTEITKLGVLISGSKQEESWIEKTKAVDFYDIKNYVMAVLSKFGLQNISFDDTSDPSFSYGLEGKLNNLPIVNFGIVKKDLLKIVDLKQEVFFADFYWDNMVASYSTSIVFEDISKYPEVRRDLSLVLDKNVKFSDIRKVANKFERRLLKDVSVFDVYEGENLGKEKKSYSVSFILQDMEQTLTDKVIDNTMDKLMKAFENELKAVIRK
ncbi:MAG TPA: phenylalanine--tRNA ligase subunit beta [Cytophagales bacterium]|nr:phenylalanine--tRNA ligase subunit beta [Cytophagales bacterium]